MATSELRDEIAESLSATGARCFAEDASDRPDLILMHPTHGLVAIDLCEPGADLAQRMQLLNRKLGTMATSIPEVDDLPVHRRLVTDASLKSLQAHLLSSAQALEPDWLGELPEGAVNKAAFERVCQQLQPLVFFTLPGRGKLIDHHAATRMEVRVRLDATQAAAATRKVPDVLVVSGPPGSGKSVVLAARARHLAGLHPDWRIQLLCYNAALVPYLRSLVAPFDNIRVETFHRFAQRLGYAIGGDDAELADAAFERAMRKGVDFTIDALLIDEWQDFFPAWTKFALETLFPHRGGAAFAYDPKQALYRSAQPKVALAGHRVEELKLDLPYRSTRSILEVILALDPAFKLDRVADAPDGVTVELIRADKLQDQARAAAIDLELQNTEGRAWSDMAVLVTDLWMISPVVGALRGAGIPCSPMPYKNKETFDITTNDVKIMSVHSGKGLEFGVVCLLGIDTLKDPREPGIPAEELTARKRRMRLALVGPSRAKDILLMFYSRENCFLQRLRESDAPFRKWQFPDDYPGANTWQS